MKNTLRMALAAVVLAAAGAASAAVDPFTLTFSTGSGASFSNTFSITPTQANSLRVAVSGLEDQYSSLAFSINGGPSVKATSLSGNLIASFNDVKDSSFSLAAAQNYLLTVTGVTKVLDTGVTGAVTLSGAYGFASAVTAPVPEPETWAMLLAGLGCVGVLARRRSRKF